MPGKCGTLLRVRFTEGLGFRARRASAATMSWILPQPAVQGYEGNPDEPGFRLSGRRGLALGARFTSNGGWTNQLDDACPWRSWIDSTRSAKQTLKDLQRSAPSLNFMGFEAEANGFILRGSFFSSGLLPTRTH
jgi:hypothetical protein